MGIHALGKATLAAPLGLAEDILEPATRMLRPVTTGAINTANTAITGNTTPLVGGSTPTQPTALQPTPAPSLRDPLADQNAAKVAQFNQTAQPTGPTNKVNAERQPNGVMSFSGNNVAGPVEYTGSGAPSLRNSGGVNTMSASNFASLPPSVEMRMAEAQALRGNSGMGYGPSGQEQQAGPSLVIGGGDGYGLLSKEHIAQRRTDDMLSAANRQSRTLRGQTLNFLSAQANNDATLRGQDIAREDHQMQDSTTRRGQDVSLRGHQMTNDATLRGQDITREGHHLTTQTARNRLAWEDQWKNKEFNNKQDEQTFNQAETRDKNLTASLEARYTTRNDKGEAVVDRAAVAEHKNAVMNHHASLVQAARARGDHATADALDKAGAAGIPKESLEQLLVGAEIGRRAEGAKGITPWSGTFNHSADPMDHKIVKVEKNLLTPDMYVTQNGSRIPRRVVDYKNGGTLGALYSQGMVGETGRKINDSFFRYNLMEQFNRSMRTAATQAAVKFIDRHADGTASDHSKRWLAELGLLGQDVVRTADGGVALTEADGLSAEQALKMRSAVNRWVDGAVLRPDAADKPIWMNDPHWALVAHLKQFVFSFQHTILSRVMHEVKNGNYAPAMALASYVPIMMAADAVKGMIQGAGSQPSWKKDWDLIDYAENAWERAGLNGVTQFGLDVFKDAKQGGSGVGALTGPALQQLAEAVQTIGGREQFKTFALHSMPANALYSGVVKGVPGRPDAMFAD